MKQLRITPLSRPVENWDRLNTPSTPERQTAYEAWQQQYDALREQFKREWVSPSGYSGERDDEEMENIESAAFTVWEERRKDRIAASSTPVWTDAFESWLIDGPDFDNSGILARQPTAASLTLPIVLKGGGDMQVTFETKKVVDTYHPEPRTWLNREHRLIVRTEHGVILGRLDSECSERRWFVVSLPPSAPQEVADRVARTLDAIQQLNLTDDYPVILAVSSRCALCSRPLKDITSKVIGIGPDCAAKWGFQHSAAVAKAIVAKRHAFLAEEIDAQS
jgi:hypothetical protein